MRWLAPLPALALVFAPIALADDSGKDKPTKLEGTWKVIKYTDDGKDESPREGTEECLKVTGSHYELTSGGDTYRGDLKLDDAASPCKIEATLFDVKDKKLGEAKGIFKLSGDDLTVCWNEEDGGKCPKAFASEAGSKDRLIVLKKK